MSGLRLRLRPVGTAFVVAAALAATACSADVGSTALSSPSTALAVSSDADDAAGVILVDVRTPEEFAVGHLQGAVNLDVEGGAFEQGLASLDPSASYAVYCRSGRRSAIAVEAMRSSGFTAVTDLGSLDEAAEATGFPLVSG